MTVLTRFRLSFLASFVTEPLSVVGVSPSAASATVGSRPTVRISANNRAMIRFIIFSSLLMYGSIFLFSSFVFLCATAGGPGFRGDRGRLGAAAAGPTSQALRASSPSQGEPRGVRRSQCLPLLRGGAERSEAERFRRVAAAGATSQALRASSPSQGEPRGLQEFPSAVPAEGKKRVPSFGSSWGG